MCVNNSEQREQSNSNCCVYRAQVKCRRVQAQNGNAGSGDGGQVGRPTERTSEDACVENSGMGIGMGTWDVGMGLLQVLPIKSKQTAMATTTHKTGQLKLLSQSLLPPLLTSRKFLCTGHTLQSRVRERETARDSESARLRLHFVIGRARARERAKDNWNFISNQLFIIYGCRYIKILSTLCSARASVFN